MLNLDSKVPAATQSKIDHLVRRLRLRTIPLFLDGDPIGSSVLVIVKDRKLVLTCDHVLRRSRSRLTIGQGVQPPTTVLLSDEESDVAIMEVPRDFAVWSRDAKTDLRVPSEPSQLDIKVLGGIDVRGRPIVGAGYPISHLDTSSRICRFSSYFGKECRAPEEYPDLNLHSLFCVRAEVCCSEISSDYHSTHWQQLDLRGMSGGPVCALTEQGEVLLCGLQSGQLNREVIEKNVVIWETVVRPNVLAECLSNCLG